MRATVVLCTLMILSHIAYSRSTRRAIDDVIRLRLLELVHTTSMTDGLVLAGTIVEGGAVYDRQRRILGGKTVHSGREFFRSIDFNTLQKCPPLTLWYRCENWVPAECEVTRYLLFRSTICSCNVNVC